MFTAALFTVAKIWKLLCFLMPTALLGSRQSPSPTPCTAQNAPPGGSTGSPLPHCLTVFRWRDYWLLNKAMIMTRAQFCNGSKGYEDPGSRREEKREGMKDSNMAEDSETPARELGRWERRRRGQEHQR